MPVYEAFGRNARGPRRGDLGACQRRALPATPSASPSARCPRPRSTPSREAVEDHQLIGFKPTEARTLRFHGIGDEDFYQFFGDDKEG